MHSFLRGFSFNGLTILCASIIILLVSIVIFPITAIAAEQAVIKGTIVNLRASPTTDSNILGKAIQGESLEIISKRNDWYQVKKNGLLCWVAGWLVTVDKPVSSGSSNVSVSGSNEVLQVEVLKEAVNIRTGPGLDFVVIGKSTTGERYIVVDKSGEWYKISLPGGFGWISAQLVKVSSAANIKSGPVLTSLQAEVLKEAVNIRTGPGLDFKVTGKSTTGERYIVLDKSGDWYKISLPVGFGWISAQLVKVSSTGISAANDIKTVANSSGAVVVNESLVNIRSGPGTNYNVLSTAAKGESFLLLDSSSDWYQVILNDGRMGWVVARLVDFNEKPEPEKDNKQINQVLDSGKGVLKSVSARIVGDNTVISIQSDGKPMEYSFITLSNPDRLVLDIKDLNQGSVAENISFISPLIQGIRVGRFSDTPAIIRVVIDLKEGIRCVHETRLSSERDNFQITIKPRKQRTVSGSKIVLDPGHGGSDPGAIGPTGLKEKDVNLDISLKVAQYLRDQGATVILTRTDDRYVDLSARPEVANNSGASLFVSIHANANTSSLINGTSTYYLRTPGNELEYLKIEGMYLAKDIQSSLVGTLNTIDKGVLEANFVVLTKSKVPVALVEVAFISNHDEEKMLGENSFRDKAASSIAKGIVQYLTAI